MEVSLRVGPGRTIVIVASDNIEPREMTELADIQPAAFSKMS